LSSTTSAPATRASRSSDQGQVLVIFGLSLVTIVIIAALAFDTGLMLLEKRDQQNAADAAALAGARYLVAGAVRDPKAVAADIAHTNGFTQGVENETVIVNVPPSSGLFRNAPGFIEVLIRSNRPSIFGGILGAANWAVGARAVAANQPGLDLPFAMLALHPTQCAAIQVTGSGLVTVAGTVQVNSACKPDAMKVGGTGTLEVTAPGATCNAVGGITETKGPGSELDCVRVPDSYSYPDPLRGLSAPSVPGMPADMVEVSATGKNVPDGCPGSGPKEATPTAPATCRFGGSYAGSIWRVFPGYYPGGLDFGKGTFLLEPGIYYMGGGGFRAAGGAVRSVDAGTTSFGGGVLIYNSEAAAFHADCAAGIATGAKCLDAIVLNGGVAEVSLKPLSSGSAWDGIVIFQDRNLSLGGDEVTINGGSSTMEVAGTIYVPSGDVKVNGSTGTLILDQVIASTYLIDGKGGTIDVRYRSGVTAKIRGAGLVE
jgi:hypothetical protein